MITADQLTSLLKSHYDNDNERFTTISLQIAAREAKAGHGSLAKSLRDMIDASRSKRVVIRNIDPDFDSLFMEITPQDRLADLIVLPQIKERVERVIAEYKQRDLLISYSLENRRKVLLYGQPGTGKTMTASVIAREIGLPMYVILMDKIMTKFMGETSARLRQIFDYIERYKAVYLFDEFDAIGGNRNQSNDVGEMRRVLNSFLQFIEQDHSESMIIAATNNIDLLDEALFRRFDDVIRYQLPSDKEKFLLLKSKLYSYLTDEELENLVSKVGTLSPAEINLACYDAIKESLIQDVDVTTQLVERLLDERKTAYHQR